MLEEAAEHLRRVVASADRSKRDLEADSARLRDGGDANLLNWGLVADLMASVATRSDQLGADARTLADELTRASRGSADLDGAEPASAAEQPAPALSVKDGDQETSEGPGDQLVAEQGRRPSEGPPLDRAPGPRPSAEIDQANIKDPSQGMRMLATQMAVAGSSREEIERRLRNDFGVANADAVIDKILDTGYAA